MNDYFPISLDRIVRYIEAKGWRTQRVGNPNILYYVSDENEEEYSSVVLPRRDNLVDAEKRISEAIEIISEMEQIEAIDLREKIYNWSIDLFTARLFSSTSNEESIPLDVAGRVIPSIKQTLSNAAHMESEPKPFFDRTGSISREFISNCRFAHTFRGSFGFKIECPLEIPPSLPLDIEDQVPFERSVLERVATGFGDIETAVKRETEEPIVSGYTHGFSANICRSLMEVYEAAGGRNIEYSISWASSLPSSVFNDIQSFTFDVRAYAHVKAAADKLEKVDPQTDSIIEGRVVALRSERPESDDEISFEHLITMNWERERGRTVKIRVPLSSAEYKAACDAHKEGKAIKITGIPERRGKHWNLVAPHDFSVR